MKIYVCILLLLAFSAHASGQHQDTHVRAGNSLYRQGKYDKALEEYKLSAGANAADPVINYNLGNAYFRNSRYEDAAKAFENSAGERNEASMRQKAFYNEGVSFSKQNKLEESIGAYKNALKLNPADQDARVNLQKALLELNKRKPPQQENKENKKKKQQDQNNQKKQNPQSNLTKKQVEQLLKALQQREQQVQQKMQNRNRTAGQQEKDW
jgi:tetratricopeptide (TPR) repeat protein